MRLQINQLMMNEWPIPLLTDFQFDYLLQYELIIYHLTTIYLIWLLINQLANLVSN